MKFAHLTGDVKAWAKRLVDDLNRGSDPVAALPFYVDDMGAAAGGVPIGGGYRAGDGTVRWRLQ
jgi:hypothetical protein